MALKTFKPNTPSNRYKQWNSFEEITKDTPQRSLTVALRKSGGRNNNRQLYYYQLISGLTEFYLAFSC
jgi:large subunit ribosomal protein L2